MDERLGSFKEIKKTILTIKEILKQTWKKKYFFYLKERFFGTNFLKIDSLFTERSVCVKTNKIEGKWTIILRTNQLFLNNWKKNYQNRSFTLTNDRQTKRKKPNSV